MMRNRTEGANPDIGVEQAQDRLKQVYERLGVPPEDAHQYAYGVAPKGA